MRQFKQGLSKLTDSLKPGEAVLITRRGKVAGVYTKPSTRNVRRLDLLSELRKATYPPEAAAALIAHLYDPVS